MALPKLTTPTYELEIPSTDEKIKYRPFLVKEEKILMMAMESKASADITQAVKDIVSECTFNKVDISNMPMFNVEYIFLNIRSKSVGIMQIYEEEGKKTYDPKDQTKKELTEFIEQLNTKQFKDVQKFFETMPKLKHEITIKNPKTKKSIIDRVNFLMG